MRISLLVIQVCLHTHRRRRAGAWTSFDLALGDDLVRDGKDLESDRDAAVDNLVPIIPYPPSEPPLKQLTPPGLRLASGLVGVGGNGDRLLSRQLWGPLYWFIIRTVIAKRNPWSHYLHRPLAELKLAFGSCKFLSTEPEIANKFTSNSSLPAHAPACRCFDFFRPCSERRLGARRQGSRVGRRG